MKRVKKPNIDLLLDADLNGGGRDLIDDDLIVNVAREIRSTRSTSTGRPVVSRILFHLVPSPAVVHLCILG